MISVYEYQNTPYQDGQYPSLVYVHKSVDTPYTYLGIDIEPI